MSDGPIIIVPAHARLGEGFTKQEQLKALEHPGRNRNIKGYQSPASWICDQSDLKKLILLCRDCRLKFNHRKNHYREFYVRDDSGKTSGYESNGQCDGCKEQTANHGGGTAFVHESEYSKICLEPRMNKRMNRAAYYAKSAWYHLRNQF
jgi:hypothetical protein